MSQVAQLTQWISQADINAIDEWVNKYPAQQKRSAVMAALRIVQESTGYLKPEHMDAIAAYLQIAPAYVYEVASFYTMYEREPVGRHLISVCTNISCKLRRSDKIVNALSDKLGINMGETTSDGRFTLRGVECLGACVNAPMMQIDKNYHEHLTVDNLDTVLSQYE